jgi:hypothetical protein
MIFRRRKPGFLSQTMAMAGKHCLAVIGYRQRPQWLGEPIEQAVSGRDLMPVDLSAVWRQDFYQQNLSIA